MELKALKNLRKKNNEVRGDIYVKSSKIKLACKYLNEYSIKENDTILVVASIEGLYVEKEILQQDGWLRLDHAKTVAINGLDGYAETKLIERFEYARPKK